MILTVSDLQKMTARQIAIFAAGEIETETQPEQNDTVSFNKLYSGFYTVKKGEQTVASIDSYASAGRIQKTNSKYALTDKNGVELCVGTIHECKKFATELYSA